MFEIILLAQAEDELADAYDWYEEQQPQLGNRFYNEINYYLTLLEKDPYLFPVKYVEELRAASTNKFPYIIIYWIDEVKRVVYVVSIFHTSRKPEY